MVLIFIIISTGLGLVDNHYQQRSHRLMLMVMIITINKITYNDKVLAIYILVFMLLFLLKHAFSFQTAFAPPPH